MKGKRADLIVIDDVDKPLTPEAYAEAFKRSAEQGTASHPEGPQPVVGVDHATGPDETQIIVADGAGKPVMITTAREGERGGTLTANRKQRRQFSAENRRIKRRKRRARKRQR